MLKEEGGFLWNTWRLITVFIILVSFGISFPIGNLELKTSVCDSLLWCWDLFHQPAAAWVAQGRGSLAAADICAWTWCFSAHLLGGVLLCTFNTSIPLPWLCWGPAICSPAACQHYSLSPQLLWKQISELLKWCLFLVGVGLILLFFMLFLWFCTWKPRHGCNVFSQETITTGVSLPLFPLFPYLSFCSLNRRNPKHSF